MFKKEREVWAACDSLFQEGVSPDDITIDALGNRLRELNYLRGKNEAISKYRKTWLDQLGMKEGDKKYDSPETIKSVMAARFQNIVEEEIRTEYQDKLQVLTDDKKTLEEDKAALESSIAELTENNTLLAEKNIALKKQTNEAEQALQERENILSGVNGRLALQTEFLEKREAQWQFERTQEQHNHQLQLDKLSSVLVEQQDKYHQSVQMLTNNSESQRHQWIKEKDDLKTENQKLQKMLDATKEQIGALKTQIQQKTAQYENIEIQHQKALHHIDDLQAHCHAHVERINALTVENKQRQENQETVQRTYQSEVSQLKETVNILQETLNRVESYVKR